MNTIIIGASSGIGRGLAERYAQRGDRVAVAARRTSLLSRLQEQYPGRILYETMDVTAPEAPEIFRRLIFRLGGADRIVYCTGTGRQNRELDPEIEAETIRVNISGFATIASEAYRYFSLRKKNGRLLSGVETYGGAAGPEMSGNAGASSGTEISGESSGNDKDNVPQLAVISSVASVRGLGISASYSASKRFQCIYMEALAQLAATDGVKMDFTVVLPGFVDTDFIRGRRYPMTMPLDHALSGILRAVDRRRRFCIIDWRWKIVVFFWKLIPVRYWIRMRIG